MEASSTAKIENNSQRNLDAVGWLDYNARWYSPSVGAFTQPDSIVPDPGNPQSLNRYAYVLGNLISFVDPTGHFLELPHDLAYEETPKCTDPADCVYPETFGCKAGYFIGSDPFLCMSRDRQKQEAKVAFWSNDQDTTIAISLEILGGADIVYGHYGSWSLFGIACNWVSGECSTFESDFVYEYVGTPHGFAGGFNLSIGGYENASSIDSLEGRALFSGVSLGIDSSIPDVSASINLSQAVTSSGETYFDRVSKRSINGGNLALTLSADMLMEVIAFGRNTGMISTSINDPFIDIPWWPLRFLSE